MRRFYRLTTVIGNRITSTQFNEEHLARLALLTKREHFIAHPPDCFTDIELVEILDQESFAPKEGT